MNKTAASMSANLRRWAAPGLAVCVLAAGSTALAMPFTTYISRAAFEATLVTKVTDDYSNPGYDASSLVNPYTDTQMSAVLGQTSYHSTGHGDFNIVFNQATNDRYCAGCEGSFVLGFGSTSLTTAGGVFGAGFEFLNVGPTLFDVFVTFGDGSTTDIALPSAPGTLTTFFGITSSAEISSMALGLPNGGATTNGNFAIDNLTIGSAIPLPASAWLALGGLAALAFARRPPARSRPG